MVNWLSNKKKNFSKTFLVDQILLEIYTVLILSIFYKNANFGIL